LAWAVPTVVILSSSTFLTADFFDHVEHTAYEAKLAIDELRAVTEERLTEC
jgi:hypothetical protein